MILDPPSAMKIASYVGAGLCIGFGAIGAAVGEGYTAGLANQGISQKPHQHGLAGTAHFHEPVHRQRLDRHLAVAEGLNGAQIKAKERFRQGHEPEARAQSAGDAAPSCAWRSDPARK